MFKALYRSVIATILLGVILCGVYPLLIYGIGILFFNDNATGGILSVGGKPAGAKLIGQGFTQPEYFHGRPSAAGTGYDAANSSGSNLGPTNQKFYDTVKANVAALLKENPTLKSGEVPTDLATASGSGLDPHISPESAFVQLDRVARARSVTPHQLRSVVQEHVEGPQWGIFGEPVVNVLMLNLDLDQKFAMKK